MEQAVALSLQHGEADCVTPTALSQALHEEGLQLAVEAETVHRLQEPSTILAAKQVVGGPGRQAMEAALDQLDAFVETQHQAWQARSDALQVRYAQCRQLEPFQGGRNG